MAAMAAMATPAPSDAGPAMGAEPAEATGSAATAPGSTAPAAEATQMPATATAPAAVPAVDGSTPAACGSAAAAEAEAATPSGAAAPELATQPAPAEADEQAAGDPGSPVPDSAPGGEDAASPAAATKSPSASEARSEAKSPIQEEGAWNIVESTVPVSLALWLRCAALPSRYRACRGHFAIWFCAAARDPWRTHAPAAPPTAPDRVLPGPGSPPLQWGWRFGSGADCCAHTCAPHTPCFSAGGRDRCWREDRAQAPRPVRRHRRYDLRLADRRQGERI